MLIPRPGLFRVLQQAGCNSKSAMPQITNAWPRAPKQQVNREYPSGRVRCFCIATALAMVFLPQTCNGQKKRYMGLLGGISALSADGRTALEARTMSSYAPEDGLAIDVFGGVHLNDFLTLQADYLWNRNPLTLDTLRASDMRGGAFYEQQYRSREHAVIGNALLYFRNRSSWVRPFLSAGAGIVNLAADPRSPGLAQGITPPAAFRSTAAPLPVAV